jgi:hypothetical protein
VVHARAEGPHCVCWGCQVSLTQKDPVPSLGRRPWLVWEDYELPPRVSSVACRSLGLSLLALCPLATETIVQL